MAFSFKTLNIPDLVLIESNVFPDDRGFFQETYRASIFKKQGLPEFTQDNHSYSHQGVLRGLHYQSLPVGQGKLVSVITGAVYDVAVDLRSDSATFGQWVGVELSANNHRLFYVPAGFAHGFVALADDTHFFYKCTVEYSPDHDRGLRWNDPTLAIDWPIKDPLVSIKDQALPNFNPADFRHD
ncbi:MAG: dTDP-4-dehydrorhamnose 3,5-epimerase [Candidatus Vogelbacteria bacterium CG10_big_fil_rev_8_21_14_0_10_50_13]|uniref:dTDP-4-dehydrorhamnose 3,5-epimerase n=1 Tax=Candidatus Vogelbacteria bacterium CG10_big_fil_rev_8_21_14_0_10_50_13 TaxID=1975044 RepID=A0A2H0RGG4_9BACT|nr:MAG: dTDP-4-dehydrorhamnose 3,5-epimerase [Candidatus Vogelbacteria bacterium CG10_big_fil_rev_8_21_14_0_10_50_13]